MRITIVTGAFLPVPPVMGGAVEKFWFNVGAEFARRGHTVVHVSRALPNLAQCEIISGVQHVRVRGFNASRGIFALKFLDFLYTIQAIRALPDADIVVTNTFWLPVLLRRARAGKIYVHVARFPKGQIRFYGRASRLQTPSSFVATAMANEAPLLRERISVIPYSAPAVEAGSSNFSQRERILLFVGRVHPEKGVHLLVEAFAKNTEALSAWKMVIIGSAEARHGGGGNDYLNSLRTIAHPVASRVTFRGPVYDEQMLQREYQSARIFVYPSLADRGETFGLAALEAISTGCATVTSALGCFDDFSIDRETGFRFDHRASNPAGNLGALLVQIVRDEALLARIAAAGLRKAGEYSLPNIADRFLKDFESVIANA